MMLPPAVFGIGLETTPVLEWASRAFMAVMMWVQTRRAVSRDPVQELTFRLQHPLRYAVEHPLKAVRRKIAR